MSRPPYFQRLVETAELIARHADYPGKRGAVEQCVEDVEDLSRTGRITDQQRDALREILLGPWAAPSLQPALSA
jgi:hypothetical protein